MEFAIDHLSKSYKAKEVLKDAMCIGFCLLYSIIACVLVYRFAPKTFRIRQ